MGRMISDSTFFIAPPPLIRCKTSYMPMGLSLSWPRRKKIAWTSFVARLQRISVFCLAVLIPKRRGSALQPIRRRIDALCREITICAVTSLSKGLFFKHSVITKQLHSAADMSTYQHQLIARCPLCLCCLRTLSRRRTRQAPLSRVFNRASRGSSA